MTRIKRALLSGERELSFEEVTIDAKEHGETWLLARTICSAVSPGTEVAAYTGQPPLRPCRVYPRRMGYCNVAEVTQTGNAVTRIKPGQRIFTHQSHQSGFLCDESEVLAVPDEEISSEDASFAYIAQLGLSALQKGSFQPGEKVAVLGLGLIGLAACGVCSALGGEVLAAGNDPLRLAKAKEMGASALLDSSTPDLQKELASLTKNKGIDLLITTANPWKAWKTALEMTRFQTRIAVLGFPGRGEGSPTFNPLDSAHFYDKQLSLLAAGMTEDAHDAPVPPRLRDNMRIILKLQAEKKLNVAPLITDRVPWHELSALYERGARRDKALIGAVLDWTEFSHA